MAPPAPVIAVVDDEEPVRKALCRLFSAIGWESVAFRSGDEFLTSLDMRAPDCILLDLQMPGLTGFDVQTQLARLGSSIPVIVLTGHIEVALTEQCLSLGAVILRKPVQAEVLIDAVRRMLHADRVENEAGQPATARVSDQ